MLVSIEQVAGMLSVSESHLFDLKRSGDFGPEPVRLGRSVRYLIADVMAWAAAGCPSYAKWKSIKQHGSRAVTA